MRGPAWTIEELMIAAIARELRDGRVLAQGIATPMVAAAYLLAKATHAPNSILSFTVGNSFAAAGGRLSLLEYEQYTLGRAIRRWSFAEVVTDLLPTLPFTEFFRPAQIDPAGNTNNVVIGHPGSPSLWLPGCGGIADVTTYMEDFYYYVPRHSPRVFVPQVDFVSGVGHLPTPGPEARRALGLRNAGPRKVFSDLGIFAFADGRMVVESIHPGAAWEDVVAATGFPLPQPDDPIPVTLPPEPDAVEMIRTEIDPEGMRVLERLSQRDRERWLRERVQR